MLTRSSELVSKVRAELLDDGVQPLQLFRVHNLERGANDCSIRAMSRAISNSLAASESHAVWPVMALPSSP